MIKEKLLVTLNKSLSLCTKRSNNLTTRIATTSKLGVSLNIDYYFYNNYEVWMCLPRAMNTYDKAKLWNEELPKKHNVHNKM